MPWRQTSPVLQREAFVRDAESGLFPFAELCRIYGVSRKTGYLWVRRWRANEGVQERSRRPKRSPRATNAETVQLLVAKRRKHPHFGAKKLLRILTTEKPDIAWPSTATANRLLAREGLQVRRKSRRRLQRGFQEPWVKPVRPNELWTIDFKGQFQLKDHSWCYPLTAADAFSRHLLVVKALPNTRFDVMWPTMERCFREYGLPASILSDNGPPFGTQGLCGLSRFAVRLLKLGIRIMRIEPGHPEQNGRHERMHRSLEPAIKPPRRNAGVQQRSFNAFRREFNTVRPHEGLDGKRPADLYRRSERTYPSKDLPGLDYPLCYERRNVRSGGEIKWRGKIVFVSELLAGEPIGLHQTDETVWDVYFGPLRIGRMSETGTFRAAAPPTKPRRQAASRAPVGAQAP